jgi:hypothetical protein
VAIQPWVRSVVPQNSPTTAIRPLAAPARSCGLVPSGSTYGGIRIGVLV